MPRRITKFLTEAIFFSLDCVCIYFLGLMPISVYFYLCSFFYNPAKIILNIKAIPLEIKLINLWALWAFITGIVVSINFDVF